MKKINACGKSQKIAAGLMAITLSASASASDINFRGFGSIVAGQAFSVEDDQTVLSYDDTWSFKNDSVLGLQMDADLGDDLTATIQFLGLGVSDFDIAMEWAYLAYTINDNFQINAGRMQAPFFRYSDYIDVHYAYNWITTPSLVYAFRVASFDGLSLLHNTSIGSIDSSLQVIAGKLDSTPAGTTSPVKYENMMGISWSLSWEWLSLKASYLQADASIINESVTGLANGFSALSGAVTPLIDGFAGAATQAASLSPTAAQALTSYSNSYAAMAAEYESIKNDILVFEDHGAFGGLSFDIDRESFVISGEVVQYEVEDALSPKTLGAYLSAGWRFGSTLVYTSYERQTVDKPDYTKPDIASLTASLSSPDAQALFGSLVTATGSDAPEQLRQSAIGANQTIAANDAALRSFFNKSKTINTSLGARWDFHPSAALKAEYTQTHEKITDVKGKALRFAIDFVF